MLVTGICVIIVSLVWTIMPKHLSLLKGPMNLNGVLVSLFGCSNLKFTNSVVYLTLARFISALGSIIIEQYTDDSSKLRAPVNSLSLKSVQICGMLIITNP